jgi:RimJ/RimL family protein N-acetyltransferase
VCSDSLGTNFYSGFGGQVDFVRGVKRAHNGRAFIALTSTAKNGAISKIVPQLSPGAGVVTSRADVQYVVTEYGVAYLYGKNIRERGLALVQIAHPKFRDELLDYLKQKHYVYLDQRTIKDDDSPIKEIIPYSHTFRGKTVYFRPLRPYDEKTIQDFFYSHQPETIYQRYLANVESLPHEVAQARVSVDYNKDMAIAGYDSPVCLARYLRGKDDTAEIGFVVKEEYQKLGVGTFLAELILKAAQCHGIAKLTAFVSYGNAGMLKILKKQGYVLKESGQVNGYFLSLDVNAPQPAHPMVV